MDNDRIVEIGARATFDDYWKRHGDEPGAESVWLQVKHIHIGNMRAVLAAFEEAGLVVEQGWQPIETAPRDGTWFVAYFGGAGGYEIISWQTLPGTDEYAWRRSNFMLAEAWPGIRATDWRPLPAPPAAKADPQ